MLGVRVFGRVAASAKSGRAAIASCHISHAASIHVRELAGLQAVGLPGDPAVQTR